MDVFLTANMGSYEDFIRIYTPGDERATKLGKSLLTYALSNTNPETRYSISNFLLDNGAEIGNPDREGNTALHILFSATLRDVPKDVALVRRLLEHGVSASTPDNQGTIAFLWLLAAPPEYSDEELTPLYDLWLEQPEPGLTQHSLRFRGNALEVAQRYPYRQRIAERLEEYMHEHP